MSNLKTLADSICDAYDTGKDATFLYNSTLYTLSPTGIITWLGAAGIPVVGATAAEINKAADVSSFVLELTASGAVPATVRVLELNHISVVIEATWTVVPNTLFIVKNTSASGTAAHTLTLTDGTFNGTNTVATLNAPAEFLCVWFDSAGAGTVIVNVGSVGLS